MQRKTLRAIFRFLFNTLCRLEVIGQENIPDEGSCLLAGNHLSRLDGPLVFAILEREDVTALAAAKYKKNPFFKWVIEKGNAIWIDRERTDFGALKAARKALLAGRLLGITPEGTRSRTGALTRPKTGAAYLADLAKAPILPTAISGTEIAIQQILRFRRPKIKVQFGPTFSLEPIDRRDRSASLQRNADMIMCRIAVMLPAAYHGVYADHPYLKELASIQGAEFNVPGTSGSPRHIKNLLKENT